MSAKTNYFHFDPSTGKIIGIGHTPDGTLPRDCIFCTSAQLSKFDDYIVNISGKTPSLEKKPKGAAK